MAYKITITEVAEGQFKSLTTREQRILETAIVSRLQSEPRAVTRAVKRLRTNSFAEFELRSGDLRAL